LIALASAALTAALVIPFRKATQARSEGQPSWPDSRSKIIEAVLTNTREELDKADLKATAIFTGASLTGTVIALAYPSTSNDVATAVMTVAGIVFAIGLLTVGGAIWPRLGVGQVGRSDYFMDIVASLDGGIDPRETFESAESLDERNIREVAYLSRSAKLKYLLLQRGMVLIVAALMVSLLTLLWVYYDPPGLFT